MTDELRKSIDRIRQLSPKLNKATDQANDVVALVERFLNDECSLGIRAATLVDFDDLGKERTRNYYLSYDRVDGKFRIAVETMLAEGEDPIARIKHPSVRLAERYVRENIVAWVSCPRQLKLAAFEHLPRLLTKLAEEVDQISKTTQKASTAVTKVLDALKKNR